MNVVKFIGGMGNQMFQYALGRMLEHRDKIVGYDISWYEGTAATDPRFPRPFRLHYFNIVPLKAAVMDPRLPTVTETRVGYNLGILDMKTDCNFNGYWQYFNYFQPILPVLKEELQLKTEVYTDKFLKYAEKIWSTHSVSVHVRRGDYQLHRKGKFRDLPAQYYFNAIKQTEGDLFFFSDDLRWCRQTFRKDYFSRKLTFVDIDDYLAFELMSYCKDNITTNSTYGYWAALMNKNPGRRVWCPIHYLGEKLSANGGKDLRYPPDWIKLDDYVTWDEDYKVSG